MDWYLPNVAGAASVLRKDIAGYVRRHAQEGSDVVGAELICAELINNAIANSDSPVWVSLDWGARADRPGRERSRRRIRIARRCRHAFGRGARRSRSRHRDPPHRRAPRSGQGGWRVTGHHDLAVERPPTASIDPEPMAVEWILPTLDEADETGGFGRESFLRALIVQLASVVDNEAGPAAAEAMVAAVGTGVGMKMEEAFRSKTASLSTGHSTSNRSPSSSCISSVVSTETSSSSRRTSGASFSGTGVAHSATLSGRRRRCAG